MEPYPERAKGGRPKRRRADQALAKRPGKRRPEKGGRRKDGAGSCGAHEALGPQIEVQTCAIPGGPAHRERLGGSPRREALP